MNVLKRLLGFVLLIVVWGPCLVVWAILAVPIAILGGTAASGRAFDIACWPYDEWIRPLMLAGSDEQ